MACAPIHDTTIPIPSSGARAIGTKERIIEEMELAGWWWEIQMNESSPAKKAKGKAKAKGSTKSKVATQTLKRSGGKVNTAVDSEAIDQLRGQSTIGYMKVDILKTPFNTGWENNRTLIPAQAQTIADHILQNRPLTVENPLFVAIGRTQIPEGMAFRAKSVADPTLPVWNPKIPLTLIAGQHRVHGGQIAHQAMKENKEKFGSELAELQKEKAQCDSGSKEYQSLDAALKRLEKENKRLDRKMKAVRFWECVIYDDEMLSDISDPLVSTLRTELAGNQRGPHYVGELQEHVLLASRSLNPGVHIRGQTNTRLYKNKPCWNFLTELAPIKAFGSVFNSTELGERLHFPTSSMSFILAKYSASLLSSLFCAGEGVVLDCYVTTEFAARLDTLYDKHLARLYLQHIPPSNARYWAAFSAYHIELKPELDAIFKAMPDEPHECVLKKTFEQKWDAIVNSTNLLLPLFCSKFHTDIFHVLLPLAPGMTSVAENFDPLWFGFGNPHVSGGKAVTKSQVATGTTRQHREDDIDAAFAVYNQLQLRTGLQPVALILQALTPLLELSFHYLPAFSHYLHTNSLKYRSGEDVIVKSVDKSSGLVEGAIGAIHVLVTAFLSPQYHDIQPANIKLSLSRSSAKAVLEKKHDLEWSPMWNQLFHTSSIMQALTPNPKPAPDDNAAIQSQYATCATTIRKRLTGQEIATHIYYTYVDHPDHVRATFDFNTHPVKQILGYINSITVPREDGVEFFSGGLSLEGHQVEDREPDIGTARAIKRYCRDWLPDKAKPDDGEVLVDTADDQNDEVVDVLTLRQTKRAKKEKVAGKKRMRALTDQPEDDGAG
ncbi:hypothetical protein FRB99_000566, partial [Tulasnella sp. 403]